MPSAYFRQVDAWVFQPAFPSWDALMEYVKENDFQGIFVKAFDGARWMSQLDSPHPHISGPGCIREAIRAARRAKLKIQFWCVPKPPLLAVQAEMAGLVLQHARLIYDVETGPLFWPNQTPAQVRAFLDAVAATGPKHSQHLCLDARPYHIARIPLAEWERACTVALPMAYWSAMQRPAAEVVREVVETLRANGWKGPRHRVWPILEYADPAGWVEAEQTAKELNCRRASYWLLPNA